MRNDMDLFQWAAEQPPRRSAEVINARKAFAKRQANFFRLLVLGYQFRTSGGADPVDLAAYRQARKQAARAARRATAASLSGKQEEVSA